LSLSAVARFWWPLAFSWLLMAIEWPVVNVFVARLGDTKQELAALGIAISLSLAVMSPITSLLTAATALARDRVALGLLRRFMWSLVIVVTTMTLLLSFTPVLDVTVGQLIGAPIELVPRVRAAFVGLTLWPAAIGYRRFYQGVMIRHGDTRQIGYGTVVRLFTSTAVGLLGLVWGRLDGATVGGWALGLGSTAEAAFAHWRSLPALRKIGSVELANDLTWRTLLGFYTPLALTAIINLSTSPFLNYGIAHSPYPVASLAAWPVIDGQLFVLRSFGLSLQEAVVALLDGPAALKTLRRFTIILAVGSLALLALAAFTSVGPWWQTRIAGLDSELNRFALDGLRLSTLLPTLAVSLSWLRGIVITERATHVVAQATAVNLLILVAVLLAGAALDWMPGASLAAVALTASRGVESLWLWRGARPAQRRLSERVSVEALSPIK